MVRVISTSEMGLDFSGSGVEPRDIVKVDSIPFSTVRLVEHVVIKKQRPPAVKAKLLQSGRRLTPKSQ